MEMKKSELTHGSLFSGIGGPEIAAEIMGWKNVFHCEINPFGRKILDYWFPNSKSYEDITKTDFTEWREKSMSSPEVSHASLFLAQDSERERKMTATSGRKCYERYGRFSPIGLLVKTLLESSRWYSQVVKLRWDVKNLCSERLTEKEYCIGRNTSSKQCVTTLNVKDIPSNRLLFRLVPSERRTEETVSSLLPTVQTQGLKVCNENGKTTFYPVGLLPTPMSTDIHHAKRVKDLKNAGAKTMASRRNGSNRPNGLMDFMDFHGMLPTPTASCHNPGTAKDRKDGSPRTSELNHLCARLIGKTSLLNPLFVAEMMGFPPDWTVLPFQSGGRNR